jgi:hypothetical protein
MPPLPWFARRFDQRGPVGLPAQLGDRIRFAAMFCKKSEIASEVQGQDGLYARELHPMTQLNAVTKFYIKLDRITQSLQRIDLLAFYSLGFFRMVF